MCDFFKDIFNKETCTSLFIALLLGCVLGVFYNTPYSLGLRTAIHKVYLKINPSVQKDSKTIIMEKVSGDINSLPQKDIFETPSKENKVVLFFKKIFIKKSPEKESINTIKFE